MNLDKLQIDLQPRNYWQAIDLGLKVTRQHLIPLTIVSAMMTTLVLLFSLTITQHPIYSCLLLFWLKPLVERPLLFYISRAIFSEKLTIAEIFHQLTSILSPQWFKTLTIYRISVSRSFNEPVVLLERQEGEKRNKRTALLARENDGAFWLTLFGLSCEVLIYAGLLILPILLLPESIDRTLTSMFFGDSASFDKTIYFMIPYAISIALVAPFYSVCGFILYLNRRTQLEAWHIELGFRKLAQRFIKNTPKMLMLCLALSFGLTNSKPLQAETEQAKTELVETEQAAQTSGEPENTPDSSPVEEANEVLNHDQRYPLLQSQKAQNIRQQVTDLLSSETFGKHYQKTEYDIDWDLDWDWDFDYNGPSESDLAWLAAIQDMLDYFKLFIILLLMSLLAWVLIHYRPWEYLPAFRREKNDTPDQVMGFDLKKESLPDNVLQYIDDQLNQGNIREALSMMFRCHLSKAVNNDRIPFKASSTEQECQRLIQQFCDKEEAQIFSQLVQYWQQLAYAHKSLTRLQVRPLFIAWQPLIEGHV